MQQCFYTFLNIRLFMAFVMGISSGLPLLVTLTLMQAWAQEASVDLGTIGLMSLVGLPYTVKFLWSPIFDRFTLHKMGRRKAWLLVLQAALFFSIFAMGQCHPEKGGHHLSLFVVCAALIAFFSASQDVVIDAYRREDLKHEELGIGSTYYIYGYRLGMIISSSGGLILSDYLPWNQVFFLIGCVMIPMFIATMFYKEPVVDEPPPQTFRESVIDPFVDYFKNDSAILVLAFILLYKLGDSMATSITMPFYLELGYSKSEIGSIVKLFGFWATMIGSFLGGSFILKIGIKKALLYFGFLQMITTAGFALLAVVAKNLQVLALVIVFENVSAGMGTAAFVAFMASMTNKKYTATQYSLLSSLMGVPRVIISSMNGYLAEILGWFYFYMFCTLIAIPGLLLILKFSDQQFKEKDSCPTPLESST